jgi:pimeloyl-ACP methyl ester carboxylesterase
MNFKLDHYQSEGFKIAYIDEGEGDPILLIHGFASNLMVNWGSTGWIDTLRKAGRRVVAFDNRGHGGSAKPSDPNDYRPIAMARDAANLLDHLGIARADIMGYSMGARVTAFLAHERPDRVRSGILGGLGMALVEGMKGHEQIVAALEAPSADAVENENARSYRIFADRTGADLRALAACMRGSRETIAPAGLVNIRVPVLVAVGTKDRVAGSAHGLAQLIPGAEALDIPDREHMQATGDKIFKEGALDFLSRRL